MQLSIRAKVILIILAIIAGMAAASVIIGVTLTRRNLKTTIINDMGVSGAIAEQLVSEKISGIKTNMRVISELCQGLDEGQIEEVLRKELAAQGYLSLRLMYQDGRVISFGAVTGDEVNSRNARRALRGGMVLSTTEYDSTGALILRFRMSLDDGAILIATLPGTLISDTLSRFRIWKTGSIFVLDREGTFIAGTIPGLVQNRVNYIKLAETDNNYRGIADVYSRMIQWKTGSGEYTYGGVPRFCVYRPVRGSDGWSLGLICPVTESPMSHVLWSFLITGAVFLGLGSVAAFIAAAFIARPFKRAEELALVAESASEAKGRFLASMSHEMRTPLNAIIGFAEMELGKEKDDAIKSETWTSMEKIYSSGVTLLGLINDILDLSKIESGKFELAPVNYDMPSMINDTVTLNIVRIGSEPILFKLDIDENLPARLYGDEPRIKQILNNLLSNAFKYTREGEVTLKIRCERDTEGVWMICGISDTGMGIREEDIDKLFGEYNQVDTGSNRHIEGIGLELAITKRLVEMMRGNIYVKSEYGRGSTFTVRLFQGFAGDEVIGKEVATSLAEFRYGFQDFLTNPIDIMKMDDVIDRWVRDKKPEKEPGPDSAENENRMAELIMNDDEWDSPREEEISLMIADMIRAAALEELDWEKGLDRFGGDGKSYMDSLRSYAVHTPALIDRMRTVGTLDEYAVIVHSIKGSSYGISADGIGLKAERLEHAARNSNLAFVEAEHDRFIAALEKFIARLTDLLDTLDLMWYKPSKIAPDKALLDRILEAVENYDMGKLDQAMEELEQYNYEAETELVSWLRDQIDRSEFEAVKARLMSRDYNAGWPIGA
jgi:signal transduction histidine kinase